MPCFEFGGHIGSGGFGSVEKATLVDDNGDVIRAGLAQKKLLAQWVNDADALARFKREVRLLDEMSHPNVLPVVGRNLSDDPPWFVMPEAESSLAAELAAGQAGDRDWVLRRFTAILNGMAYAHSQRRILHRDLKPENVLVVDGELMVSDFGLGKRLDPNTVDLTSTNIGMGTMAYAAPEQFTDASHVGPQADVYSIGKMLGEMLTGVKPLVGRPRLEAFPSEFQSFIDRCTQDDPADRYANASDALVAFELLVAPAQSAPTRVTAATSADFEEQLRRWEELPEGEDKDVVAPIAAFLEARREDEDFYSRTVPRLPPLLTQQLIDLCPSEFNRVLNAYNGHTQGTLPFEYCDVLANFYRQVYLHTDDPTHMRLILTRLIELGPTHNRWHVGDVVADLLKQSFEPPVATMAAEVINSDPSHARWFRPYVRNLQLPPPIAAALASLDLGPDEF